MFVTLFLFVLTAGNDEKVTYLKALSENVFKYPLSQVSLIFCLQLRYCKTVLIFMYRGRRIFVQNIYLISISDIVSHGATQTLVFTTE